MSLTGDQLGSFSSFATAIGLMRDGSPRAAWFGDPVGDLGHRPGETFAPGLRTVLADDVQRDALTDFVDEVLGPPDREAREEATWIPLFVESTPAVTIYAVLEPRPGSVRIGVGLTYESGTGTPRVTTRAHVPIFQVARRDGTLEPGDPTTPDWLLLGGPQGTVTVGLDAVLDDIAPSPGEAALGGVGLSLSLPTSVDGDLAVSLELRQLQLTGASSPRDFSLGIDDLDELGAEVLDLLVGLVRAQADALDLDDPDLRPFAALTGVLGLREVPDVPAFPLAELASAGTDAVVGWVRDLLATDTSRDAWLAQLASLLGGVADAAQDAVRFTLGPAEVLFGLRVDPGVSGLPVLVPWAEIGADTVDTGGGGRGRVELTADLLRLDTGTGDVAAVPTLRADAVLGRDAGGPDLLAGDPGVGTLTVGIALDEGRPKATVLLHDVVLRGNTHDVLDLASPEALRDAADDVVTDAVADALAGLGPAADALAAMLGLAPPAGVDGIDVLVLVSDPLAALAAYWSDLVGAADGIREVLGRVPELVTGAAAAVAGAGTQLDPWRLPLGDPVFLDVRHESGELRFSLTATTNRDVLEDHEVEVVVAADLARVRLADVSADLVTGARGELRLRRADGTPIRLGLVDVGVRADHVALTLDWRPSAGPVLDLDAPGLQVSTTGLLDTLGRGVAVRLPRVGPDGVLGFAPDDWRDVEDALAALLGRLTSPTITALLQLLGWRGDGPRLSLGELIAHPDTAVGSWLSELALDCDRVREAMSPVALLLSGFRGGVQGSGSPDDPFRCRMGGDGRAPGLAVWLEPGCPPSRDLASLDTLALRAGVPVAPAELVAVMTAAAQVEPAIGDLLAGREGLPQGMELLRERWTGSDGVVAPPAALPDGVAREVLPDTSYDELVAAGATGALLVDVLDALPTALVHVGCEQVWTSDRPPGTSFDLSAGAASGALPPTGDGEWTVRLPEPAAAGADRPDRGAVGEQAARLSALLADRTAPATVVAYGAAAAAALRASRDVAAIDRVVTVGAPWGPVATATFATGLGGDALRLLELLRAGTTEDDPVVLDVEAGPGRRLSRVVARAVAALSVDGRSPSAVDETPRAGLPVTAVFGELGEVAIERGLAELVADGLDARLGGTAPVAEAEPTALGAGIDVPSGLDLGGLLVGVGATLRLATVTRDADEGLAVATGRHLAVDVRVGVRDGWLVGGPGARQNGLELRWFSAADRDPARWFRVGSHGAHPPRIHRARYLPGAMGGGPRPDRHRHDGGPGDPEAPGAARRGQPTGWRNRRPTWEPHCPRSACCATVGWTGPRSTAGCWSQPALPGR